MTERENTEILLRPGKIRWGAVVAVGLAGLVYGIYVAAQGGALGWLLIFIFAPVLIFGALHFVPGLAGLRLTARGFEIRTPVRRKFVPWTRVRSVRPGSALWTRMVLYDLDQSEPAEALEKYYLSLGRKTGLPETYGMDASELAEVMYQWRIEHSREFGDGEDENGGDGAQRG